MGFSNDVSLRQILFFSIVPLLTVAFVHAWIQTYCTHRVHKFNSMVLLLSIVINCILITQQIECRHFMSLVYLNLSNGVIVYILYRIGQLNVDQPKVVTVLMWTACIFASSCMSGLTVASIMELNQYHILVMKMNEFLLGFFVYFQCKGLLKHLTRKAKGESSATEQSKIISMRKRQLRCIQWSYVV
jgi:hypothetical protein